MKRFFFSLAVFAVLLMIGCSENSITNPLHPLSHQTMNKAQNYDGSGIQGSIPLEGVLVLPVMFNSYYAIDGQTDYNLELTVVDPIALQDDATLNLSIKAILTDVDVPGEEMYISEETTDVINIPEDEMLEVEKSFPVQGNIAGLNLVCKFLVTRESVALEARRLTIIEKNTQATSKTESKANNDIIPPQPPLPPVFNDQGMSAF